MIHGAGRSAIESAPLLKIHNATVVKNGKKVLDNLAFEIQEGEHTAILGPNGAGKSSLIKLIARQDYPLAHADGTPAMTIFGQESWNVFELRPRLGIVSADVQFFYLTRTLPGLTRGLEAVLSGFFASFGLFRHQEITEEMKMQAWRALKLMEAGNLAEKLVEQMSTGELRRIMIARSLAPNPRALILDEPTTGLDLLARHRFLETLHNVSRQGKTIILVTHHVEEIFPEIQRVILMQNGKILVDGKKPEVLTAPHLSAMFEAPISVRQERGYYLATCSEAEDA
jgi:iron complex transport system ATP-binding protein